MIEAAMKRDGDMTCPVCKQVIKPGEKAVSIDFQIGEFDDEAYFNVGPTVSVVNFHVTCAVDTIEIKDVIARIESLCR